MYTSTHNLGLITLDVVAIIALVAISHPQDKKTAFFATSSSLLFPVLFN
jgi:hypothetical protein